MKFIIGFLLALLFCCVSFPAQAASFGLSPATIDIVLSPGNSKEILFTSTDYSGSVDVSVENMPVVLLSSSEMRVTNSKIAVTIQCNQNATSGVYDGRLVFIAKSGKSILSGIKVICNLTVVEKLSGSQVKNMKIILGDETISPPTAVEKKNPVVSSNISTISETSSSPTESPNRPAKKPDVTETTNDFNFLSFAIVVVLGLLCAGALFAGYKWIQSRKKI